MTHRATDTKQTDSNNNQIKVVLDDKTYIVINILCNTEIIEMGDESVGEKCDVEKKVFAENLLDKTFFHVFDCTYDAVDDLKIRRESFRPEIISTVVDNNDEEIVSLISVAPVLRYTMIVQSEEFKPCNTVITYIYNHSEFVKCTNIGSFASQPDDTNKWFDFIQTNSALTAFDNVISTYDDNQQDESINDSDDNEQSVHNNDENTFVADPEPDIISHDASHDTSHDSTEENIKMKDFVTETCTHNNDTLNETTDVDMAYNNYSDKAHTVIVHADVKQKPLFGNKSSGLTNFSKPRSRRPSVQEITREIVEKQSSYQGPAKNKKSTAVTDQKKRQTEIKKSHYGSGIDIFIPKKVKSVPILNTKTKEKPFVIKVVRNGKDIIVQINDDIHLSINKKKIEVNKNLAQKLLGMNYFSTELMARRGSIKNSVPGIRGGNNVVGVAEDQIIYEKKTDKTRYKKIKQDLLINNLSLECLKILFQDIAARYNFDIKLFINKETHYTAKKFFKDVPMTEQILIISMTNLRKRVNIDNISYKILDSTEIEEFITKEHYDFKIVSTSICNACYCIVKEITIANDTFKSKY